MFECKGCEAKDQQIKSLELRIDQLLEALEKAQARVMELAEPGVNRRMARPTTAVDSSGWRAVQDRFRPQYPGYEMRREDVFEVTDEKPEN